MENFDGNLTPNIRNHGDSGRIIFQNIHISKNRGIVGAAPSALNTSWIASSNNHYIKDYYTDSRELHPRVSKVFYQKSFSNFAINPTSNLSVIEIPLYNIRPSD